MGKDDQADVSNVDEPIPEMREKDSETSDRDASAFKVRPWVRFFARMLDYTIFAWVLSLIFFFVGFPIFAFAPPMPAIALIFIWCFIEAAFLSGCNTTPGKALFGIYIEKESGRKLTYGEALSRALSVWLLGMGAGLPVVYLVTWIVACVKLSNNGFTSWDKRGEIAVHYKKLEWYRIIIAVLIYLIVGYLTYMIYA